MLPLSTHTPGILPHSASTLSNWVRKPFVGTTLETIVENWAGLQANKEGPEW